MQIFYILITDGLYPKTLGAIGETKCRVQRGNSFIFLIRIKVAVRVSAIILTIEERCVVGPLLLGFPASPPEPGTKFVGTRGGKGGLILLLSLPNRLL